MRDLLSSPLVQMFVGAAITWFAAWFYYRRAGEELRAEASALHTATSAIVYFLEHPDAQIEARRDDQGRIITGLIVSVSGHSSMSISARGTPTDAGSS